MSFNELRSKAGVDGSFFMIEYTDHNNVKKQTIITDIKVADADKLDCLDVLEYRWHSFYSNEKIKVIDISDYSIEYIACMAFVKVLTEYDSVVLTETLHSIEDLVGSYDESRILQYAMENKVDETKTGEYLEKMYAELFPDKSKQRDKTKDLIQRLIEISQQQQQIINELKSLCQN